MTGTLIKPESKKKPSNRGAIACQVELQPLTYTLDLEVFLKELPHVIQHWGILLHTPDDAVRSPVGAGGATGCLPATPSAWSCCSDPDHRSL